VQPQTKYERSKSTQKMIERVGSKERKNIIEMAQAIRLPPIREIENDSFRHEVPERCSNLHSKLEQRSPIAAR
jgi:hypothetical protein